MNGNNSRDIGPRDLGDQRRGRTIKETAALQGVSESLIKRAISWGRIKVVYFGDRPIIPAEENERISREGLPNLPQGYKHKIAAPGRGGRPRRKSTAAEAGKPTKPTISPDPRRKREAERRTSASD